jgi:hypothetical protein
MIIRAWAFAALVAAAVTACGGSESATPEAGPGTQTAPAASIAAGQAPSAHPAPSKLQGTWSLISETITEPVHLYLRESTYAVSMAGPGGEIAVEGNVIEFTSPCGVAQQEASGRYRWRIQGANLHLDAIGRDECSYRSQVLADATYRRSG